MPTLLRTRWPYLAAGLFILVNLNLVVYNLTTGFDSLASSARASADYAAGEQLSPRLYIWRLGALVLGLLQNLGGVRTVGSVSVNATGGKYFEPAPGRTLLVRLALARGTAR